MKIGDKVKVNKDIPSINGMLHKGTVVKVDEISGSLSKNAAIHSAG